MIYPIKNNEKIISSNQNLCILLNGSITIGTGNKTSPIPGKSYFFFDSDFDIIAASPFVQGYVSRLNGDNLNSFPDLKEELSNIHAAFEISNIKNYEDKKSKIKSLMATGKNSRLSESYLHILWSEFIADYKNSQKEQSIIEQFAELIDQNLEHNYCAGTYAEMMGISLKKLIKEVRKNENKTPCNFITEKVIEKAKHKLIHTKDTSQMIAFQLGFDDPYYFIKYFKKHTKLTPTQFRNQHATL